MKPLFEIVNQLALLENKLKSQPEYQRYFSRCKQSLEEMGVSYFFPLNEKYSDTRTDLEAHITGSGNNMTITDVIKPIILHNGTVAQKGIVIVETV